MESRNNIEKLNSVNGLAPLDEGDDLFSPSEKVWENVSKHLPIKKKRRPILPIFLLGMALTMGSIYIWNSRRVSNKDQASNQQSSATLVSMPEKNALPLQNNMSSKENTSLAENKHNPIEDNKTNVKLNHKTYEKRSTSLSSEKKTETSFSNSIPYDLHTQKPDNNKTLQTLETPHLMTNDATSLSKQTKTDIGQNMLSNNDATSQMVITYTAVDSVTSQDDITFASRERLDIKPLELHTILLEREESPVVDELQLVKPNVNKSNEWMFGIAAALSPMPYNSPKVKDPLEGTIKQSAYTSVAQINFAVNKSISEHFFISFDPGLRYDRLSTAYDLNIPYNYNTEVILADKKENYFSHSLPTDLGNIKTKMVVVRASDSPVVHNEDINISFDVNYKTLSLTSPIGIHYAIKNKFEGFYVGVRFVPQYVLSRNADVTKYESHHTYVKSDHVDITKVSNYNNLYMGGDLQLGYRLPLAPNRVSLDINATYHKNLMSEGRPHDLGIGVSILKSF